MLYDILVGISKMIKFVFLVCIYIYIKMCKFIVYEYNY